MMNMSTGVWIPPSALRFPLRMDGEEHAGSQRQLDRDRAKRVIVVDDETRIASTLVEILRGEGFEAQSASTGETALELARTFQPDIVLSDVIIPGLNGV